MIKHSLIDFHHLLELYTLMNNMWKSGGHAGAPNLINDILIRARPFRLTCHFLITKKVPRWARE